MRDIIVREAIGREVGLSRKVALVAHAQYESLLSPEDWQKMKRGVSRFAEIAKNGTVFVAEVEEEIVGAVVYLPPGSPKPDIFWTEWAIIRMLSVSPDHRASGIGRRLSETCIRRAEEDGASTVALHTGEMMSSARRIYEGLGFESVCEIDRRFGFRYWIYTKQLPE